MALIAKYISLIIAIICHFAFGNPKIYNIGAVLSSNEAKEVFSQAVQDVNTDMNMLPTGVNLNATTMVMNPNPIQTALSVCKELIANQVYAVVVSKPQTGDLPPSSVSYTCGFYRIPVVGISSRDSVFSDKNIHVSFVRTVPPYSHQADVWISLLPQFRWKSVIIIYSSDQDGESLVGRFQNLADDKEIRVEKTVEYEPGLSNLTDLLMELKLVQSRVILLYASARDAQVIYRDAENLNMTGSGYAWIVTEQALEPSNTPTGVLGLQLINQSAEKAHIKDSVKILGSALRTMYHSFNITEPPRGCTNSYNFKETGQTFLRYIMDQVLLYGETGKVAFDKSGDRLFAEYKVINIQDEKPEEVGSFMYSRAQGQMKLTINESKIIWPGNELKIPEGYMIPSKLKVVTIIEKPFVYVRQINRGESCNEKDFEVYCPHFNNSSEEPIHYCCYGYCIRLLTELAKEINFTYDLHICEDSLYGNIVKKNGSEGKGWNGMIGELLDEKADMIVAPLTINPERAAAIEFSKPFKYQGITILERKPPKSSTLDSFLQPFQHTLWILVMFSVHVVALVLYLLDRFSPFGRFKLANSEDTEEDALNLSSAVWFAWGVLLNSGIGEGTPRSFSARVMGMVWAGFAMIMVASYTANLAAFLVLDRPESSIIGINDPRLRNPQENFTYATVKGSSVDMYFRRQVELSTMYRTMEAYNYERAEDAIQAVKNGSLNAFIWDSSRLEYEAANDCDLVTAGELFGRSGYGIGLRKYSPWADQVTLTILGFHESGFMEDLDSNWILVHNDKCDTDENAPATLGLTNMAGVFILVGGGIAAGIFLIFIEIVYKRHQMVKQKEMELARNATDRWRGTIEKRRILRENLPKQRPVKSNGVGDGTGSGSGSTKEEESQAERMSTSLRNNPVYNADSCSDNLV